MFFKLGGNCCYKVIGLLYEIERWYDMSKKAILKLFILFFWVYDLSAQTVTAIYGSELHPLVEISDQGQAQTLNIFGPRGQVLAQVVNDETRYLLADHQRSTRIVLKEDNSLLGSFDYTPYGETNSTGDVDSVPYRYTGQPVNFGLSSYHFYQREYNPNILRFTRIDPARYNESPYIYSNSNPTNFMDPTGGQPTSLALWFTQRTDFNDGPGDLTDIMFLQNMRFTHNYSSSVEGYPTGVVFRELGLKGQPSARGSIFSDDVRLGSIIISSHGNYGMINVDPVTKMGPEAFFDYFLRRVAEIDPLGVEQVKSITFLACRLGCPENDQPSFADRFLSEIPRRIGTGEPYFSQLDRVVSSPYAMSFFEPLSNKDYMLMQFSTDREVSLEHGTFVQDRMAITLDTAKFLRGDGPFATTKVDPIAYRDYYRASSGPGQSALSDVLFDEPKADGVLSFPTFFLKESYLGAP